MLGRVPSNSPVAVRRARDLVRRPSPCVTTTKSLTSRRQYPIIGSDRLLAPPVPQLAGDLPAPVGECVLDLLQVGVGEHLAGERDADRQDAVLDRLPGEDLALLVEPEASFRHEIQIQAGG